jgi:hypothetical protein
VTQFCALPLPKPKFDFFQNQGFCCEKKVLFTAEQDKLLQSNTDYQNYLLIS